MIMLRLPFQSARAKLLLIADKVDNMIKIWLFKCVNIKQSHVS